MIGITNDLTGMSIRFHDKTFLPELSGAIIDYHMNGCENCKMRIKLLLEDIINCLYRSDENYLGL